MKYLKKRLPIVLTSLVLVASAAFQGAVLSSCSQESSKDLIEKAKSLYSAGKTEDAEYQLSLYLQDYPSDIDANILLGDWYAADGNNKSFTYYRKAAKYTSYPENSLNYNTPSAIIAGGTDSFTIKPSAKYTKSMTVTFSSNMFRIDRNSESGKINRADKELEKSKCSTTQWFSVNPSAKNISVFGNINCAVWQFMDENNNIEYYEDDASFNQSDSIRFTYKTYSCADIPEGAVKARLTYYDPSIKKTVSGLTKSVYAVYGSFVQGYSSVSSQTYEIPDLNEGEYVEYKNSVWTLHSSKGEKKLKLEKVPANSVYVSIAGDLVGELDYSAGSKEESDNNKSKEYGISYNSNSTVFACHRTDDAVGMNFNYKIDDTWANEGENDFDKAYPWCEIKRCNVKSNSDGKTTIVYEGDKNYKTDGSNGNVMVEIPKFYTSRTVKDGYESIKISGTMHDGYQLDPAFVGSDGGELEHIYVAAYPSAVNEKSGALTSTSQSFPAVKLLYKDVVSGASKNGSGYGEIDYVTYSALQKLFIIETGNINSTSIFSGDTANYYFYTDEKKSGYAVSDSKKSNEIVLNSNTFTQRLAEGDSITLFSGWDEYKNTSSYHREIEKIATKGDLLTVTFTGSPIDIKAGKTAISNIPVKCGKTDEIDYCTGVNQRADGKASFKYRGMENLYGSVMAILDGASFVQQEFSYTTADGTTHTVYADIPVQNSGFVDPENMNKNLTIKSMIYDENNPSVMLPSKLGNGASSDSAYGDFWMLASKETSITPRYLAAGGANDNFKLSGIFQMRAFIDKNSDDYTDTAYLGSRIMFRQ